MHAGRNNRPPLPWKGILLHREGDPTQRPWETRGGRGRGGQRLGGIIVERMYLPWNSSENDRTGARDDRAVNERRGWFSYFSLTTLPSPSPLSRERFVERGECYSLETWVDDDDVVAVSFRLSSVLMMKMLVDIYRGRRWRTVFFFGWWNIMMIGEKEEKGSVKMMNSYSRMLYSYFNACNIVSSRGWECERKGEWYNNRRSCYIRCS